MDRFFGEPPVGQISVFVLNHDLTYPRERGP
jgi:hypothetical protein